MSRDREKMKQETDSFKIFIEVQINLFSMIQSTKQHSKAFNSSFIHHSVKWHKCSYMSNTETEFYNYFLH